MSRNTTIILIILMLSTLLPRFAPFWFYKTFKQSSWWKSFALVMPSLLLGVLVMLSLSDSFFNSLQWIEISGLMVMVGVHLTLKKPMITLAIGSIFVILLKTLL